MVVARLSCAPGEFTSCATRIINQSRCPTRVVPWEMAFAGATNLDIRLNRPHRTVTFTIETRPLVSAPPNEDGFCADVGWQNNSL